MRASRRFWGKDWRGFFPQQWVSPPQGFNTLCSQEWRCMARPAFPQNHGFTLCKDLTHSRLLAGGSFSGTKKASFFAPKNAWKQAGFIGSRQAYYWQEAPSHKHAVSLEIEEGKPFCAKNAWKEAGSASVGSAHKQPHPSSEVLGKGLALFFPPNNGFPLCKDLSHDHLGFLNYPRPHGLGLFSTKPWIYPLQGFNPCPR